MSNSDIVDEMKGKSKMKWIHELVKLRKKWPDTSAVPSFYGISNILIITDLGWKVGLEVPEATIENLLNPVRIRCDLD